MAETTLTTVAALLKEVYGPRVVGQLNNETTGFSRIKKSSEGIVDTPGGKYVDFPIHVGRNHGIGYRLENEALPTPGTQQYAEVHAPLRYGYAVAKWTGQAMRLARTNPQAFANATEEEMSRLKDDVKKDQNRIMYGDGTGLLASVTADGANTVTVDDAMYLEKGMNIDILTRSTGAAVATSREITAISGNDITYSGADVAATANEGVYRAGNFTGGSQREPTGLDSILSETSVLHGVDPAVEPKWAATINDNSGTNRPLSEGLMIQMCDDVRVNGGMVSVILTSLGVRRAYFNLLTQQRRYADTKQFDGGLVGLAFHYDKEVPVVTDVDHPKNTMDFLSEKDLTFYEDEDWHWADDDGEVVKWVSGYDNWQAFLRKFWEFGATRRNTQGQLRDITEG